MLSDTLSQRNLKRDVIERQKRMGMYNTKVNFFCDSQKVKSNAFLIESKFRNELKTLYLLTINCF